MLNLRTNKTMIKLKSNGCILLMVLLGAGGCNSTIETNGKIEKLTVGLNHYEIFKLDKKDSLEFIPPPPPPFLGNISNVNVFESGHKRVYFYVFKSKEMICGYVGENEEYNFEVYNSELKDLRSDFVKELDRKNMDSFVYYTLRSGSTTLKPMFSIGIIADTSENDLLLELVNKLYQNSYNNVWKIRRVNKKENSLL